MTNTRINRILRKNRFSIYLATRVHSFLKITCELTWPWTTYKDNSAWSIYQSEKNIVNMFIYNWQITWLTYGLHIDRYPLVLRDDWFLCQLILNLRDLLITLLNYLTEISVSNMILCLEMIGETTIFLPWRIIMKWSSLIKIYSNNSPRDHFGKHNFLTFETCICSLCRVE